MDWYGWGWIHNEWIRLTGPHDSIHECSRRLSAAGDARGIPDRLMAITTGSAPTWRPSP